jgi:hypothetical protein
MTLVIPAVPVPTHERQPRDWRDYNEKLVQRGDISLYLDTLITWDDDLEIQNSGKDGRPFEYPEVVFIVALILRFLFQLDYRGLEGILRALGQFIGFSPPHYSTIYKRCKVIDLKDWLPQKPLSKSLILSVDSSGIKIDNYSDWMRHKWHDKAKNRRGWIKMHVIVDTSTHVALDVEITKEDIGDQQEFIPLVQSCIKQGHEIDRVLGDGIYDVKEVFNFLEKNNIKNGIPPRQNASRKSRGSPSRAEEVRFYQDYGEKIWKLFHEYNKRPAVERTFSAFKQLFGEHVMARKWENIVHELKNKFWLLNWNLTRPLLPMSKIQE